MLNEEKRDITNYENISLMAFLFSQTCNRCVSGHKKVYIQQGDQRLGILLLFALLHIKNDITWPKSVHRSM